MAAIAHDRYGASERLGHTLGRGLSLAAAVVSRLRRPRALHAEAVVYRAHVDAARDSPWHLIARRLAGPALVCLSSAWWRGGRELPDALGVAIRFRERDDRSPDAAPGDQDLLLATIRHPWTAPFAPFSTHVRDFLDNDYYGSSPFALCGAGVVCLRAVSSRPCAPGWRRRDRLARAVADGNAWLRLEARRRGERDWWPVAVIRLTAPLDVDERALRFSPFRDARGIVPRGFVHALRRGASAGSLYARGLAEE